MGFGFVVARFGLFLREVAAVQQAPPPSQEWSSWIGTALVVLGVVVTRNPRFLAASEHWRLLQRLNLCEGYVAPRWSLGLLLSAVLVLIGSRMAAVTHGSLIFLTP